MPEFLARKRNGVIIPHDEHMEEFNRIPDNELIKVKTTNPRSSKHQGLFFAAIKCAFDNWPEKHDFKPIDEHHLRQWLECKAGYRRAIEMDIDTMKKDGFTATMTGIVNAAISQGKGKNRKYVFITNTLTKIWVMYAESIAYDKLSQDDFNTVSKNVSEILKEHTGIGLEEFKMNMGKVA